MENVETLENKEDTADQKQKIIILLPQRKPF